MTSADGCVVTMETAGDPACVGIMETTDSA